MTFCSRRHTYPARCFAASHAHDGEGDLRMLDSTAFETNLLFLHDSLIPLKSSIGHHFHNQMEEMFVILDNEAEFTVAVGVPLDPKPVFISFRLDRSRLRPVEGIRGK